MAIEISGPLLNRDLGSIDTLRVKLLLEEGAYEILGRSTVSWKSRVTTDGFECAPTELSLVV